MGWNLQNRPISSSSRSPLHPTSLRAMAPTGGPSASVIRTLRPLLVWARSSDGLVSSRAVLSPAGGPKHLSSVFLAWLAQQPGRARRISPTRIGPRWPHRGCIKASAVDSIHSSPFSSRLPYRMRKDFSPPRKESSRRVWTSDCRRPCPRSLAQGSLGVGESFIWWRCSGFLAWAPAISHRASPSAAESSSSLTALCRLPFLVSTPPYGSPSCALRLVRVHSGGGASLWPDGFAGDVIRRSIAPPRGSVWEHIGNDGRWPLDGQGVAVMWFANGPSSEENPNRRSAILRLGLNLVSLNRRRRSWILWLRSRTDSLG
jgi:hypothetical protein